MIDVVGAKARKVADGQTRMKRARLDEALREQSVAIQQLKQTDAEVDQTGNLQQGAHDVVGRVCVAFRAVIVDVAVHGFVHGEDIVFHIELHLAHRTVQSARL